jgi:hypothetical protein
MTMSSTGGKSYNETAPLGAEVDVTDERQLEAVRSMRRDGTLEQAQDSDSLGTRLSESISDAVGSVQETASDLYGEARDMASGRVDAVAQGARSSAQDVIDRRPLQVLLGAAAVGFLLGRFG